MSEQLFVVVNGSGLGQAALEVESLAAGLELRDAIEAGWRKVGFVRNGFNPAQLVKWSGGGEVEEWRIAVVVRDGEWRKETVEE